jgi:hypothetical protein
VDDETSCKATCGKVDKMSSIESRMINGQLHVPIEYLSSVMHDTEEGALARVRAAKAELSMVSPILIGWLSIGQLMFVASTYGDNLLIEKLALIRAVAELANAGILERMRVEASLCPTATRTVQ